MMIFVGYDREGDPVAIARVFDELAARFGEANLFMDRNYPHHARYDEEWANALANCDIFIAIIGENWLDRPRTIERAFQHDYFRAEITAALQRKIAVIPVRVGREGMLARPTNWRDLPGDMREFSNYLTRDVTHEHFRSDMAALVQSIESILHHERGVASRFERALSRLSPVAPAPRAIDASQAASVASTAAAAAAAAAAQSSRAQPVGMVPAPPRIAPLPAPSHSIETLLKLRRAVSGRIRDSEAARKHPSTLAREPEDEIVGLREKLAIKEEEAARYRIMADELLRHKDDVLVARQEAQRILAQNEAILERTRRLSEQQEDNWRRERKELPTSIIAQREMAQLPWYVSSGQRWPRIFGGVAVVVAAGGLAYVFRDRLVDVSRFLMDNADRLLILLGLSKGASVPLLGVTQLPPVQPDLVDCSVFAPPAVRGESRFMVQIFLHLVEQTERAEFLATAMDDSSMLRGRQTLQVPITRDTPVRIVLDGQGIEVGEPVQELVWRGEPNVATFSCKLSDGSSSDVLHPIARIYVDGRPVGRILFQVKREGPSVSRDPIPMPELTGGNARTYRFAFLSYASEDRAEVLKRAQALEAANIGFFQDVLSLNPGERYERKIYRKIDEADLFMLFWSRSARSSKWVNSEIEYARTCQRMHPESLPDIVPIVLDDPRDAPPPELLSDQHFNGMIATMISYEGQRPKRGSGFLSRWFGLST